MKEGTMKTLAHSTGIFFPAIPSLFEDVFNRDWLDPSFAARRGATLPAANVKESNDQFVIEIAAPGMKRDNFKIELQDHTLTVSADIPHQHQNGNGEYKYTRREFSYQFFQRAFSLPEDKIEGSKISARYNNGVLYISVPKRDEKKASPARLISIS